MKNQLSEIWGRLNSGQRRMMIAVGVLTVVMLGVVLRQSLQPDWVLLYGGLQAETAAAIVDELGAEDIPYKLARQGTAVMVERNRLYELRLQLANKGLPGSSGVGFEIFDRTSLPGTQFSNQVNLQRALQGELSRSINCIGEVMASRVHLVLPKDSLYGESTKASASVVLTLRPGTQLAHPQVQGLVNLLAAAVEGLKPQAVTVVDSTGNILSGGVGGGAGAGQMTAAQLETKYQFEESLRQRLQSMLDAVIGQHKAIVRVQAELSFDTEQMQSEVYSEPEGGNGGLTSAHIVEETYEGSSRPTGAAAELAANVGADAWTGNRGGGGKYLAREETRNYELSKQITEKTTAAGQLKRLTIAAIVDKELEASAISQVQEALEAASGYDETRGDKLVIESMEIAAKQVAEESKKEAEEAAVAHKRQQQISAITHYGSGLAAVVVLGAAILFGARQVRTALGAAPQQPQQAPELPGEAREVGAGAAEVVASAETTQGPAARGPTEAEASSEQLAEVVRKIAGERPDAVVKQLERWVGGG